MKVAGKILKHPALMLPLLICLIGAATAGTSIVTLFTAAVHEEETRLTQMVRSQARLMEAVAKFDATNGTVSQTDGAFDATMQQIIDAHTSLNGFGETGEFVIGRLIDGKIALLQPPRFEGDVHFKFPDFVPVPMQKALAGESGHIIAPDYKGNTVLASYEPVAILNLGLVAKIDQAEVYRPFIISSAIVAAVTVLMLALGVYASRLFSGSFAQLKQSKQRAEEYLDIAGTIMVVLDKNGTVEVINRKGCEILGYCETELVGQNWFETTIPAEEHEQIKQVFAQLISGDLAPVENFENCIIDRAGVSHMIAWHNTYIKDESGNIVGCLSAGEDVTNARETEAALRISQARFDRSQEFANIGTWDWNVQTGELYWSPRIAPLFGYAKGELETTYENFVAAIHPEDRDAVSSAVAACVEQGVEYNIEHRVVWPDGTVRWLHEKGDVVRDDAGTPLNMLGVVQDITESKGLQAQLIQSSKMATLGEMATGVAHELNQPLNVINMAIGNIHNKLDKGTADPAYLHAKLDKVRDQINRATAIIDHMRIFGRKPSNEMALLDPSKMVAGSLMLIGEQLRLAGIDVTTESEASNAFIRGHQVQIEQVLLNLLSNAQDVLKEKDSADKRIAIRIDQPDGANTVRISVTDNGGGIDDEHLTRIFEPFYTTKEIGKGTGLGLSISYGIVHEMGGAFEVHNVDDGACFTITAPCHMDEAVA